MLTIETIGLKLKQNKDISPIIIHRVKKLLSQYADNLWTATKLDKSLFDAQFRLFREFQEFSGLCINYNKTEIMRIGAITGSKAEIYSRLPLTWSDGPITVLGITIYPSMEQTVNHNYEAKLKKIENILKVWGSRSLSLVGKVMLVNTLVVSQLLYCLQILPAQKPNFMKKYDAIIRKFIWSRRKPKISLGRMYRNYEQGGLKLTDIRKKAQSLSLANFVKFIISVWHPR